MENYIGEIRAFTLNKIPSGWVPCNGQSLPIQDKANQALYSLIGVMYGGDNKAFFNVPDLRGRAVLGYGKYVTGPNSNDYIAYAMASKGGSEGITLAAQNVPSHTHAFIVSDMNGNDVLAPGNPTPGYIAAKPQVPQINNEDIWMFTLPGASVKTTQLNAGMVATVGGASHENRMPYLPLLFCIALSGIYPQRD
ncbi:MAG: tail fiber protein [Chitinophagaceae bacterium]